VISRRPWAEVLDAQIDERRIQRVWRGVESRVRGPRSPRLDRRLVGASVVVIAMVALGSVLRPAAEPPPFLALADGSAPTARTAHEAETITFADGSRIALDAGAEVVPTRNDRREIALRLTRGAAHVSVTPGGPRRWRFDCGLATVEVIGTVFSLDRSEAGVRVAVARGHVHVTAHDGRTWDLLASHDAWVAAPAAPVAQAEATEAVPPSAIAGSTEPRPVDVVVPRAREPRSTRWTELAVDQAYDRAYEALGDEGAEDELDLASPRELLLLADVARLSGHPAEAVAPLERLVSLHADAPEAALAAVVLGRVQQDALHAPDAAARAFEQAEALGVPVSLAADVRARLALAYLALGDPRGLALARRSLAEDPDGPHVSALRAQLD
jgi:transmembrane sensor